MKRYFGFEEVRLRCRAFLSMPLIIISAPSPAARAAARRFAACARESTLSTPSWEGMPPIARDYITRQQASPPLVLLAVFADARDGETPRVRPMPFILPCFYFSLLQLSHTSTPP